MDEREGVNGKVRNKAEEVSANCFNGCLPEAGYGQIWRETHTCRGCGM